MMSFVWQNRLVKLDQDTLCFSRVGSHDDFDYYTSPLTNDIPFALRCGTGVYDAEVIDDGHLRLHCKGSSPCVLVYNSGALDMRIDEEDDWKRGAHTDWLFKHEAKEPEPKKIAFREFL